MMLKAFLLLNFYLLAASCSDNSYQATTNLSLYYRYLGSNNGQVSYLDFVVLTNYTNKSKTFRQLYESARHYIDTVNANRPVSSVTFIGQKGNGYLPKPSGELFEEQKKYLLVEFGFNNYIKNNSDSVELKTISLWKYSTPHIYLIDKGIIYNSKEVSFDSLMNSRLPFDSDF